MATITLELNPFPVPNDVTGKMPGTGKREDGIRPTTVMELSELSEETLAALCDEFTQAVFAAAGKTL